MNSTKSHRTLWRPRRGRRPESQVASLVLVALVAALGLAAGFAAPARAGERSAVPERYQWRLTDIYPSQDAWYQAKEDLAARIPGLTAFQGSLGESAARLYQALSARMDVDRELYQLRAYASFLKDQDTRLAQPQEMDQIGTQLGVEFSSAVAYMRPEILALGAARVWEFVRQDPRLEPYRPFLDDILRYAPHTLGAAEEKIASQAGMMAAGPSAIFEIFKNADMPYPEVTLSTGETVRLDDAAYNRYRALPDREDRRRVFQAFWSRHQEFARTLGTALDAQLRCHVFDQQVHHYDSCLEASLFTSNIPVSVYTQLLADVHANLPTLHRYLRLRQRMMGLDTLRYEDLYAPILKEVDLHYTPEQAMGLVLQAVAPLGSDYVTTLAHGYQSGWMDLMPSTGKRSGAYSDAVYGVHPYQLLNFTGLYEGVATLAHESGHSMHSSLSDSHQPYASRDYRTAVAEVASTLNENLLVHYLLGQTADRDTRLFLLGSTLDDLRTTLFRQTLLAEFELKIHQLAEQGQPLTGEKLNALYLELVREYYGDAQGICRVDDLYGVEWAFIPHLYWNFYMFQYATSVVAASAIAAEIRSEAAAAHPTTKARDAYLRMLSAGASRYPIDLLKDAGVDMTTSAAFNAAMREMNGIMDEMEKLFSQKPAR